jgi:cell volume regulation protein A
MFVARPLATIVATRVGRFDIREALLVGWAGLRGAVPIVLATFPVIDGIPEGRLIFDIAFFAVLLSTLLQGATVEPLARALGLTTNEPATPRSLIEVGTIRRLGAEVLEFPVAPGDALAGRLVNEAGLPREALVSVIVRGEQALLPRGSTEIEAGDRLHILVRGTVRDEVEGLFDRWRDGPVGRPEPPPLVPLGRPAILTARPWREEDGDAGSPTAIHGIPVRERLRVRRGSPGALVQLEDGRFGVTGDGVAAAGGAHQMSRYSRDRIRGARDPESRAWWQEVAGVLAGRH